MEAILSRENEIKEKKSWMNLKNILVCQKSG
jgi:hypothetical protein